MLLWTAFALLTAVVIAVLARPLLRPQIDAVDQRTADIEVYRDQLREIETERERGLIEAADAEAARAELARRLLRAAEQPTGDAPITPPSQPKYSQWTLYGTAALIPLASLGIYLAVGSPGMPGKPQAERALLAKGDRNIGDLLGMVEARLKAHPEDGQGWEVIAPVYLKQQRFMDAARAYANAIRILGESPDRINGFADALVFANDGLIVPDARQAYQRLLVLQPDRPEPRFWLAIGKEQDGDLAGAKGDLEAMLSTAPADARWRELVQTKVDELKGKLAGTAGSPGATQAGGTPPAVGPKTDPKPNMGTASSAAPNAPPMTSPEAAPAGTLPPPAPGDMAAIQRMSPQEQKAFIGQMVEGLAKRLEQDGKDLEGWKRLARAYKVMGRDSDANAALAKARQTFAAEPDALKSLDALARQLGIGS